MRECALIVRTWFMERIKHINLEEKEKKTCRKAVDYYTINVGTGARHASHLIAGQPVRTLRRFGNVRSESQGTTKPHLGPKTRNSYTALLKLAHFGDAHTLEVLKQVKDVTTLLTGVRGSAGDVGNASIHILLLYVTEGRQNLARSLCGGTIIGDDSRHDVAKFSLQVNEVVLVQRCDACFENVGRDELPNGPRGVVRDREVVRWGCMF
ncbi:hypothetical protein VP1G_10949 [Cytospora mali]|uniref:Uncharacterized protein n=1 Tax=Cytospora mali TaxID=578113 RepID=A0A194V2W9_CYTMA|nr:hypothetical protein VP1G_10949 [Valsa mali var. pyri (nom. inval.)]